MSINEFKGIHISMTGQIMAKFKMSAENQARYSPGCQPDTYFKTASEIQEDIAKLQARGRGADGNIRELERGLMLLKLTGERFTAQI